MANKIFISSRSIAMIIAILGGIWAWQVHTRNIKELHGLSGRYAAQSGMVRTADDPSYTAPAENFYRHGVWKDNTQGVSSYIQRPPMIGMIHYGFFFINRYGGHGWQKYISTLLHVLALYLFGLMAVDMLGKKWAIPVQLIYAFLPCFWGYIFYTITECITPSLLIFLFYGGMKYQQQHSGKWLVFQGLIVGFLLLTRPQLGIFILPFLYFLWTYLLGQYHRKWMTITAAVLLAFGGFITWQIRSVTIARQWTGLHPIYHATNNTQYRPVHGAFGELFKIWEPNCQRFHETFTPFWTGSVDPVSKLSPVDHAMRNIPSKVFKHVPSGEFERVFRLYEESLIPIKQASLTGGSLPGETELEKKVHTTVDSLTRVLRKKMWVENYLATPVKSSMIMFSKSQLNLFIFQWTYRGKWWMEALRYTCLLLILSSTFLVCFQFLNTKNKTLFIFCIAFIIYLFYLFFVQKLNEERYLFPLLPLVFLFATERLNRLFSIKRND